MKTLTNLTDLAEDNDNLDPRIESHEGQKSNNKKHILLLWSQKSLQKGGRNLSVREFPLRLVLNSPQTDWIPVYA